MTAASYGDAEVARVLIEAGAQLDLTSSATAGGVPGGTALLHAAVFGMTDVVDALVAAGTPIDAVDERWGRQALRVARENGRANSVHHLISRGADPGQPDVSG